MDILAIYITFHLGWLSWWCSLWESHQFRLNALAIKSMMGGSSSEFLVVAAGKMERTCMFFRAKTGPPSSDTKRISSRLYKSEQRAFSAVPRMSNGTARKNNIDRPGGIGLYQSPCRPSISRFFLNRVVVVVCRLKGLRPHCASLEGKSAGPDRAGEEEWRTVSHCPSWPNHHGRRGGGVSRLTRDADLGSHFSSGRIRSGFWRCEVAEPCEIS